MDFSQAQCDIHKETDPIQSHFDIKWLEDFLDTLNIVFGQDWTEEMGWRYMGRKPKRGKMELNFRKK